MTGSGFGEWYSGSIDIRGDWDNPYLASSPYDREYVHTGWALWVDMNPHVWVEATDAEASEDSRDEAKFSVKREGGDPSQAITVHVGFGGSATASGQPASAFPEGIAFNGEADYTVEGATYNPDTGGWTVQIPAGQTSADVTVKPLNDSAVEGMEVIQLSVSGDPDGVEGGEYALAATHPGTTNPASRPATATVNVSGLIGTVTPKDKDGNKPGEGDIAVQMEKLNHADWPVRNAAKTQLDAWLADYPSLESRYEATLNDPNSTPEQRNSLQLVLNARLAVDVTIGPGNQIGLALRQTTSDTPGVKTEVVVLSDNSSTAYVTMPGAGAVAEVGGGTTQVPNIVLTPRRSGTTTITVKVQQRDASGQVIPDSVKTRTLNVVITKQTTP